MQTSDAAQDGIHRSSHLRSGWARTVSTRARNAGAKMSADAFIPPMTMTVGRHPDQHEHARAAVRLAAERW